MGEMEMNARKFILTLVLLTLTAISGACSDAGHNPIQPVVAADAAAPALNLSTLPVPSGFRLILSGNGIRVYRKDYAGGQPDYVTAVDLRYAYVANLTGPYSGAPNARISKRTIAQLVTLGKARNTSTRQLITVVNGTFFDTNSDPAAIAFGLKRDNVLLSTGYGVGREYPGLIRTLSFSADYTSASIQSWAGSTFTSAPEVVGGLDVTASKSPYSYVPRTFVGVRDGNGDGRAETLLVFASKYARQPDAATVLRNFGARQMIMLDGGASGALWLSGSTVYSGRTVPHGIGLYSGKR
jgi:hypothetical protein